MDPDISKFSDNNRPERKFNNVVLPQPDGPSIAVKFPGLMEPNKLLSIIL